MTVTYADANIEDIRGDGCPENTQTHTSGSRKATIKQSHEWEEV
jgi:hypothetical protein